MNPCKRYFDSIAKMGCKNKLNLYSLSMYYGALHLGFSMTFNVYKYFATLSLHFKYSSRAAITFVAAIAALFTKVQSTGILLF